MLTRSIFLTEHLDNFIDSGIEAGRYEDASDVVREGSRLLEQCEAEDRANVDWLRGAAKERTDAIESGAFVTLKSPAATAGHLCRLHAER